VIHWWIFVYIEEKCLQKIIYNVGNSVVILQTYSSFDLYVEHNEVCVIAKFSFYCSKWSLHNFEFGHFRERFNCGKYWVNCQQHNKQTPHTHTHTQNKTKLVLAYFSQRCWNEDFKNFINWRWYIAKILMMVYISYCNFGVQNSSLSL